MTVIKLPGVKLPPEPPAELPYIEPYPVSEFFCADLARVHVHGPFTLRASPCLNPTMIVAGE